MVCTLALIAPVARAADDVTIVRLDGTTVTGRWVAQSRAGVVSLDTDQGQADFETADLMLLRPERLPETADGRAWPATVWLESGSIVPAQILEAADDTLTLWTPLMPRWELPRSAIAGLRWNQHRGFSQTFETFLQQRKSEDVLLAIRDGRISPFAGSLESLGPDGGQFNFRGREAQFTAEKAWGVVMARVADHTPAAAVCTIDASHRLAGDVLATTTSSVRLQVSKDTRLDLPLSAVREIRFRSDRVLYLSDLEAVEFEQRSVFDVPWPLRRNRSASNALLRLRGQRFSSGLGMHAWSSASFEVPPEYSRLAVTVGIDDATRGLGEVQFVVLDEDGEELFRSETLSGRDAPLAVVVDIRGHARISLVAEPIGALDIGGHANWAEARFIK